MSLLEENKSPPSYTGKVKIFFGGRCLLGPDLRLAFASLALIILPAIIYDGWLLTWMIQRWKGTIAIAIVMVILEIMIVGLFIRTAVSDPGVIPRQIDQLVSSDRTWYDQMTPLNPPKHQDVTVHGHLFKMKYCNTCHFYRPPRCVHCSICDNCVDKFDHHCPWVGNCIGRRNYRSFLLFVLSASLYVLIILATAPVKLFVCLQDKKNESGSYGTAFKEIWEVAWDGVLLSICSLGFLWFLIGLTGYHAYLVTCNQTTYEQIKGFWDQKTNPWDRGLMRNVQDLLLQRRRPKFETSKRRKDPIVYSLMSLSNVSDTGRVEAGGSFRPSSVSLALSPLLESAKSKSLPLSAQLTRATGGSSRHINTTPSSYDDYVEIDTVLPAASALLHRTANHFSQFPNSGSEAAATTHNRKWACPTCLQQLERCRCQHSDDYRPIALPEAETSPSTVMAEVAMDEDEPGERNRWIMSILRPISNWGRSIATSPFWSSWVCIVPQNQ